MGEPNYRLEGIVHTRSHAREVFEGPLDVIFLLLSKNKIEIRMFLSLLFWSSILHIWTK